MVTNQADIVNRGKKKKIQIDRYSYYIKIKRIQASPKKEEKTR